MDTDKEEFLYKDLTYKIIGLAIEVHTKLGYGFLEKVYENSLMLLFRRNDIQAEQQAPVKVYFEDQVVGDYLADILVENKIILELKSIDNIADIHRAQVLNYLKATGLRIALILNFGKTKLQYERLII